MSDVWHGCPSMLIGSVGDSVGGSVLGGISSRFEYPRTILEGIAVGYEDGVLDECWSV